MAFQLDYHKLIEFSSDFTKDHQAAYKKWGDYLDRGELGQIDIAHMCNTLVAHSRGRIHAHAMGVRNTYEQHAPEERVNGTGRIIYNHAVYQRVEKHYILTIDTLQQQADFIGPKLLEKLQLSPAEFLRKRIKALQRGEARLLGKLGKLEGGEPAVCGAV